MTGAICDKNVVAKVKGKMGETCVQPALIYGMKTVALTRKQVKKL